MTHTHTQTQTHTHTHTHITRCESVRRINALEEIPAKRLEVSPLYRAAGKNKNSRVRALRKTRLQVAALYGAPGKNS